MKTFAKPLLILAALSLLACGGTAFASPGKAAQDQLKTAIDQVIDVLKDPELSKPEKRAERRREIMNVINDRFDFGEMAKRALGRHWKEIAEKDRGEFVALFTELLTASYAGKIEGYTDEKVLYNETEEKGRYFWVHTTIQTANVDIPIVYRMFERNGEWWVYDVVIEDVSLVSTYRSQFNQTIARESYAELVKKLQRKLQEIHDLDKAGKTPS
jgi:phospholipid transport system substrate-binding protein